jgi:hypothetical protein
MTTDPFVPGPEDDLPDELWMGYPATRFGTAPGYRRRGDLLVPADLATTAPAAAAGEPAAGADTAAVAGSELEPLVLEPELLDDDVDGREPVRAERLQGVAAGRPGSRWGRRRADDGEPVSADDLEQQLAARRDVVEVTRADELARTSADAEHQMAMAAVAAELAASQRERAEQARDTVEEEKLAALHRHTAAAGARAQLTAEIRETAEMRALRRAKAQKIATIVLTVCLLALGGWSTAGVHDGLVRLLGMQDGSFGWWAGWALEPVLIAIVAGLIVLRPVLRSVGGELDKRAHKAEIVALGASLALNLLGGWHPGDGDGVTAVLDSLGQAVAHSIGAIGAAGVAWLFGVVIDSFTNADPWKNAERIETVIARARQASGNPSARTAVRASETAIRRGKHGPLPVDKAALPEELRKLLTDVRQAITEGRLPADPSANSIYRRVMNNKGDRNRSTQAADLVRGWRPLHSVDAGTRRAS